MFRLTRPLYQALKRTTGLTGLTVHPNPLPELTKTLESTLSVLSSIPQSSVYRQGVEALTQRKLNIIEEALDIASDELRLAAQMVEWKAWEPLEEKPEPGQWEYIGQTPSSS
ncbi:putative NADH-ubiquinone oxidoreductase [Infundibulicybe gibba]|nr:putative NADH-ubiquinone oxidoreductase [Infundibulicybe gibba]